jgi:hypothetical protein
LKQLFNFFWKYQCIFYFIRYNYFIKARVMSYSVAIVTVQEILNKFMAADVACLKAEVTTKVGSITPAANKSS